MRIPLKELVRSLMAGEAPRANRRLTHSPAHGAAIECVGVVRSVQERDGSLLVEMDGEWSITDLDADGFPSAVETMTGRGCIALGLEHHASVHPGSNVHARNTTTLVRFESSVS